MMREKRTIDPDGVHWEQVEEAGDDEQEEND
jgi:hypothetical protein